jgi:hypothetical protein
LYNSGGKKGGKPIWSNGWAVSSWQQQEPVVTGVDGFSANFAGSPVEENKKEEEQR